MTSVTSCSLTRHRRCSKQPCSEDQSRTSDHCSQDAISQTSYLRGTKERITINRTQTEAICFSIAPKREELTPQVNRQELLQSDTPTYLGVKLQRPLTWSSHIMIMLREGHKIYLMRESSKNNKESLNEKLHLSLHILLPEDPHGIYPHPHHYSQPGRLLQKPNQTPWPKVKMLDGSVRWGHEE